MGNRNPKVEAREKRKRRIRKKIHGTAARPRLSVFRSARHIYAQVIDDVAGQTLAAASSLDSTVKEHDAFESKVAMAQYIGKMLGQRAKDKGITTVVFDRNGFLYHGRVKALSDGAREAGLTF